MKKIKIIAFAMSLVMVASIFAACGKENEETPQNTNTQTEESSESKTIPPIESDDNKVSASEENASENASKSESSSNSSGSSNKPVLTGSSSSSSSSSNKPVTTTKPSGSSGGSAVTTTKPSSSGNSSSGNGSSSSTKYAYFTASTGEKIKYPTETEDGLKSLGVKEDAAAGVITFYWNDGGTGEQYKCFGCGKYLCDGCTNIDVDAPCPYCGRPDCVRYLSDGECYGCGKWVAANTCHHCLP